ncbi:MAG: glucose-6-phosphate isomerase [Clostridia bacterium]|nr:glucose-6-phosphate isomerase [Clostridia bacterium]
MVKMKKHWQRFVKYYYENEKLGLSLDISRMNFADDFMVSLEPRLQQAFLEMNALEAGALANPDEQRRVGHYWLRRPELAPDEDIAAGISATIDRITQFAETISLKYTRFVLVGIGGSALGPMLVTEALPGGRGGLQPYFIDNTDPDGIDRVLAEISPYLTETLVLVASKSGDTPETKNGMQEVQAAFRRQNLDFTQQAIAITTPGSRLDQLAEEAGWLARFPLWDWVGGRTSVTSAVGLLPAALQGVEIGAFLQGAADCDEETRKTEAAANPAALLALMWYYATGGKGQKDMVILPYKDALQYLARYLQQLIMESLGKEKDRDGREARQGISVYGNKGSSDQHAYVQQLLDGVNNFFVTFVEVQGEARQEPLYLQDNITSGDYLQAFLLGTREALSANGRESVTVILRRLDAYTLGVLIALFERAVGLYASLVNVNAYNQPGVEKGKKGAGLMIGLMEKLFIYLKNSPGQSFTVQELAAALGCPEQEESLFKIMEYLNVNGRIRKNTGSLTERRYSL